MAISVQCTPKLCQIESRKNKSLLFIPKVCFATDKITSRLWQYGNKYLVNVQRAKVRSCVPTLMVI